MELNLHGTDDQLENYVLGRLPDTGVPVLEEHLMVCAACRERLDQIENFALGMQEALKSAPLSDAGTEPFSFGTWLRGFGVWGKPAFSLALAAVALAVIAVFVANGRTKFAPVASLQLTAMRGEMPFAAPAREIDLTFVDAPKTGGPFRVEVVDATGNPQWKGVANTGAEGLAVKVQHRLVPGDYFVRLYSANNQVLHEYGFRVRG